jgi:hypothetical protein
LGSFDVYFADSLLDNNMTLDDVSDCPVLVVKCQRKPISVEVHWFSESSQFSFQISAVPTATLADIESEAKSNTDLSGAETEFLLKSKSGGSISAVEKLAPLCSLDLEHNLLVIRESGEYEINIALLIRVIPRFRRFKVTSRMKLRQLETTVRSEWHLDDISIDFALIDPDCEITQRLSLDTAIGTLTLSADSQLAVVQSVQVLEVHDIGGERPSPPIAVDQSADELEIKFQLLSDGSHFTMRFGKNATIGDARTEVGKHVGVSSAEFITLLLQGKALKDGILLNRLRIGANSIAVYVKDMTEVLLTSAFALRQSLRRS